MRDPASALDDIPIRAALPAIPLFSDIADELLRTVAERREERIAAEGEELTARQGVAHEINTPPSRVDPIAALRSE